MSHYVWCFTYVWNVTLSGKDNLFWFPLVLQGIKNFISIDMNIESFCLTIGFSIDKELSATDGINNRNTQPRHSINIDILDICHTLRGCHGHDRMVVGFTTTYAISAYHH